MGFSSEQALTPAARSQVKKLEESQKRRATRSLRDGIDRILVDLLSLYRDVLMVQLEAGVDLVNEELQGQIANIARRSTPQQTLFKLAQIEVARTRIAANVRDLLVMEALAVNLRTSK